MVGMFVLIMVILGWVVLRANQRVALVPQRIVCNDDGFSRRVKPNAQPHSSHG